MAKPEWLRIKAYGTRQYDEVAAILKKLSLNTVCNEANCPNMMECFSRRTATFMISMSIAMAPDGLMIIGLMICDLRLSI